MRRWKEKYERFGFFALFDGRRGKASTRRVPSAVLEEVLRLYRERYFDLNVRHFHEKLVAEHGLSVSYTWTKGVAARRGARQAAAAAGHTPQAAGAPSAARDALAHRRQPAPVVLR